MSEAFPTTTPNHENNYANVARAQESAELMLLLDAPSKSSGIAVKNFPNLGLEATIEPIVQASRNLDSHQVISAVNFLHDLKQEHADLLHAYVGENDSQGRVIWANKVTVTKVEVVEEEYPEQDIIF
jgi:hypothetical protein